MPLKVKKKDGRLEDFDRNKVNSGLIKSGATPEEAESITGQIEGWAQGAAGDGIINASDIRLKILELLQTVNQSAAKEFAAYQKQPVTE